MRKLPPSVSQAKKKFWAHQSKSKQRNIDFRLTFEEWWNIWQTSGKWDLRGCKADLYVMSRYGDLGAYEVGNVFIQKMKSNSSDAHKNKKVSQDTKLRMREAKLGRQQNQISCLKCQCIVSVNNRFRHWQSCL